MEESKSGSPGRASSPKRRSGKRRRSRSKSISRSRSRARKQKPLFPVGEIHHALCRNRNLRTVDATVPIYLAAVEEYVAHEILELSGNHALSRNSNHIDVEDVVAIIREDPSLSDLLKDYILGM